MQCLNSQGLHPLKRTSEGWLHHNPVQSSVPLRQQLKETFIAQYFAQFEV